MEDYEEEYEHSQMNKSWKPGHVYVVDYGDGVTFKIGHTTIDPEARLKQIAKGSVIMPMHLVMSVDTDTNAYFLENIIHMALDYDHVKGEWFKLTFSDLVQIYQMMEFFGHAEVYDRWYDIVPKDYQGYIDHGAIGLIFPCFTREEKIENDNFWKNLRLDWDAEKTQLHNNTWRAIENGTE